MDNGTVVMGRFQDVSFAADTLDKLRQAGVEDDSIEVISGFPFSPEMLGRPHKTTILPAISLGSAALGFLVGLFMTVGTPNLYVAHVGGQPVVPIPPTALLQFEFTMIFLILGTFLGFLWLNLFPNLKPTLYDAKVSDGEIGLLVHCSAEQKEQVLAVLESQHALNIHEPEWRTL